MPQQSGAREHRDHGGRCHFDGPQAEQILAAGDADLIALGREPLADPNWPFHAAEALKIENPYAVLPKYYGFYLGARPRPIADSTQRI